MTTQVEQTLNVTVAQIEDAASPAELLDLGIRLGRMSRLAGGRCQLWTGGTNPQGYAGIRFRGRWYAVHRLVYEIAVGPVPADMELDHLCRNRGCINPQHLEAVTHAENMQRRPLAMSTSCRNGHQRTPDNTRQRGDRLVCLECNRIGARRKRAAKRHESACGGAS